MNIGRLVRGEEAGVFIGNITTRTLALKLVMRMNPRWDAHERNSPKHEIFESARHGEVAVGMGWEKIAQSAENRGKKYLSLLLDDPSFDAPLQCTAFETADGYDIVWQRPRENGVANFRADAGRAPLRASEEVPL